MRDNEQCITRICSHSDSRRVVFFVLSTNVGHQEKGYLGLNIWVGINSKACVLGMSWFSPWEQFIRDSMGLKYSTRHWLKHSPRCPWKVCCGLFTNDIRFGQKEKSNSLFFFTSRCLTNGQLLVWLVSSQFPNQRAQSCRSGSSHTTSASWGANFRWMLWRKRGMGMSRVIPHWLDQRA